MKVSKKRTPWKNYFIAAGISGLLLFATLAPPLTENASAAAKVQWKLAHKMPPESMEGKAHQIFADRVQALTNGEMEIRIYPAEQLGPMKESMEMLKAGTIQIYAEGRQYPSMYVPQLNSSGLSFLWEDRAHWRRFLYSPLHKSWEETLRREHNIRFLNAYLVRGPYRCLVTTKPVLKLADLKGLKLRMYDLQFAVETWRSLGADLLFLPWTDVYEGFMRGIIDACTAPINLVYSNKFSEVAKYITKTDEYPQDVTYMTNEKAYQALSQSSRDALEQAAETARQFTVEKSAEAAENEIHKMVHENKVTFIEPPMDEWRAQVIAVYQKAAQDGKWGLSPDILKTIESLKKEK
jgi:TRAP-type C4-dicarboxylate transport system substrate-binding protein